MNAIAENVVAEAPARSVQPFPWLLRRELWENRSLWIVPSVVAVLALVSLLLNLLQISMRNANVTGFAEGLRFFEQFDPSRQRAIVNGAFAGVALMIILAMHIVGWFYALDALYVERRDRSILFWKSLPVSDTQTVLAKVFVAGFGVAAIAFVFALAAQILMLIGMSIVLLFAGVDVGLLWGNLRLVDLTVGLAYLLLVQVLWYAPFYCWLLLVSAWSRRAAFLWAVLPPLAVGVFEGIVFDTTHFWSMIGHRLTGVYASAFSASEVDLSQMEVTRSRVRFPEHVVEILDPVKFLSDPYLWVGLAVAAAFVGAAVWLRRYREPL